MTAPVTGPVTAPGPAATPRWPALPVRPLHARPPAARLAGFFALLSWLFCAAMLGLLVTNMGPYLWSDWQVRDAAQVVRGGHLDSGKCSSKLFLHFCDATLTAPGQGSVPPRRRDVDFAFASFDLGQFEAMVVADPRKPELLTTDLALEHFWSRVITLALFVAALAGLVVFGILRSVRTWRDRALWRRSPALPVPLRLTKITRSRSSVAWTVVGPAGAASQWTLPRGSKPYMLDGGNSILGLQRQVDGAVMPLDARLRWVALSKPERAAAIPPVAKPAAAAT